MPDPPLTKPNRRAFVALIGGSVALVVALVVYCSARSASESLSKHGTHVAALQNPPEERQTAPRPGATTPPNGTLPPASPALPPAWETRPAPPVEQSLGVYALPLLQGDAAVPPEAPTDEGDAAAPPDTGVDDAGADAGADATPDTATAPAVEGQAVPEPPLVGVELGLTQCGRLTCRPGYECCCEACVPRSEGCNDPNCPASSSLSLSVPCGMMLCDPGDICCDANCGACATAGECPENPCN